MRLQDFYQVHRGQRCFLLGSGPSLATMDLSGLKNEITFSCNNGHLYWKQLGFPTMYWACEDHLDWQQWGREFERLQGPIKFVASDLTPGSSCVSVPLDRVEGDFTPELPFKFGGTVMYLMLQLANYMGCSVAYLLGNDFNYDPEEALEGTFKCVEVDDYHFCGEYWPKGSRAFPAQPERMRRGFVNVNRAGAIRVVNLTPGTKLDVFEVDDYETVLQRDTPRLPMQQHSLEIDAFAHLLFKEKPVNAMEIGVLGGGVSAMLHNMTSGIVIGVDKSHNLELGKRFPRYRHILGDSHDKYTKAEMRLATDLHGKLDVAFIDGDHSYCGVKADYEFVRLLMKPGGIIAFHDINADASWFEPWEEGGVPRFWSELQGDKHEYTVKGDFGGIGWVRADGDGDGWGRA